MNKDSYYLDVALTVSERSSCLKKHYGAVIVKDDFIISTGYNGNPAGEKHCETCTKVDSNKDMQEYATCPAIHAEMNATLIAAKKDMIGSTLYLACFDPRTNEERVAPKPCEICLRLIKNAGIKKVITRAGVIYARDRQGLLKDINELAQDDLQSYLAAKIGE